MEVLEQDPLSARLFVFANRRGDKLKLLYYEGQSLYLLYNRLARGRFRMPASAVQAVELTGSWTCRTDYLSDLSPAAVSRTHSRIFG